MIDKPTRAYRKRDPEEKLHELDTEIKRVRTRDEKRLITLAQKAGYFEYRLGADATLAMFEAAIAALDPGKPSTLAKLESDAARLRTRIRKAARADDARRKVLLGGFLVAQCRHRSELHTAIAPDIRTFLAQHRDPDVAARNLALLKDFLADPASTSTQVDDTDSPDQNAAREEHKDRARRLILLGAWVLERRKTRVDITHLIESQLERFLEQDTHADRHKDLLADVLAPDQP